MWPFTSTYPQLPLSRINAAYDYIIIGGGTAGCVLANRLSADPSVSVLLVENGPADDGWLSRIPLFSTPFSPVPSPTERNNSLTNALLGGRVHELIGGKGLGGTSRVNIMVYNRGSPGEYNSWSAEGRKGWSYDELLPYFKKSQRCLSSNPSLDAGLQGEWKTRIQDKVFFEHTVYAYEAGKKLGIPFVDDLNDQNSPACGSMKCHYTMDERGRRQSTFEAFLPRGLAQERRSHLHICTGTTTLKVVVKKGDSGELKARGVYLVPASDITSDPFYIISRREVVLCAGSLGDPQILQRSGIGSKDLLRSLGIEVAKHLPGVGRNLQDHVGVPLMFSNPMKDSMVYYEKNPVAFLHEVLKYAFLGTGILTCPVIDICMFVRSNLLDDKEHLHASPSQLDAKDPNNVPDIEIMPSAYSATEDPFDKSRGCFSTLGVMLHPHSTGSVKITSPDMASPASIDLGILSDPRDWHILRRCVKIQLAIVKEMRAAGYALDDMHVPASESDTDVDAHIKRYIRTTFHYSSTCRMAPEEDENPGVVDDYLRVHGIKNLRVADSSIFPRILGCHLQAPTVMVAEKCADLVLKRWEED